MVFTRNYQVSKREDNAYKDFTESTGAFQVIRFWSCYITDNDRLLYRKYLKEKLCYLSTTARISICFPNGLKGSMRYKRIRKGDTGKADFTVKGRKRGMQSIILKP
jgi:hypothetical protein